jgi:hypothetical protein
MVRGGRRLVTWRLHPDVVSRRLGDVLLLVNLTDNAIYELNETGARAVELIQEGAGRDEIVNALQQTFIAEAGTVAADVDGLIDRLEAAGLLQCKA